MGDSWTWAQWLEGYEMGWVTDERTGHGFWEPDPGDDHNVMKAMKAAHEDLTKKFQPGGNVQPLGTSMLHVAASEPWGTSEPWGSTTSQADVMMAKAKEPHMYPSTLYPNDTTPVVWAEKLSHMSARLDFEKIPNDQAMDAVLEVLPKVLELYLKKSKDYGGASGELGPKAPFVDIWRKVLKLKRALWEGEELQFEQTDEILSDLIGTCLNILVELP